MKYDLTKLRETIPNYDLIIFLSQIVMRMQSARELALICSSVSEAKKIFRETFPTYQNNKDATSTSLLASFPYEHSVVNAVIDKIVSAISNYNENFDTKTQS